jgi:hypothetical protein
MTEQAGLPGAQKSLALLEKLRRRVQNTASEIPVAPATTSTRSGRVPGVRAAPLAAPPLPKPAPGGLEQLAPPPRPLAAPPLPKPAAILKAPSAPLAAPQAAPRAAAKAAAPLTVAARLEAVNWERRVIAAPSAPPVQLPVTVQARMNAVNWERRAQHKPQAGPPQLAAVDARPEPLSTVESFFSDIQW